MSTETDKFGRAFLTKWILFTAGASILALPFPFLMPNVAAIPCAAALVGSAQWLVLKKQLPISGLWILASAVGIGLPGLLGKILDSTGLVSAIDASGASKVLGVAALGTVGGLLAGLLQVSLLRPHFARTASWVVASAAGWGICLTVLRANPLEMMLRQPIHSSFEISAAFGILLTGLAVFLSLTVGPLLLAVVTGFGLSWTVKHRADPGHRIGGLQHQ